MRRLFFFFLTFFLLMPTAWADSVAMQLDYEAPEGCSTAERFADSVSAKLGFVPWQDGATARLRVRIGEDGGEMVGTLELPDGNSKVVRNANCAQLMPALVATVAVALDSDGVAPAPPPLAAQPTLPRTGRIHIRSTKPGVTVSVITQRAVFGGSSGVSWEEVCIAPCSFEVEPGITEVVISGNAPPALRKVYLGPQEDAFLMAKPGSSNLLTGGYALATIGLAAMLASGYGFLDATETEYNYDTNRFEKVGGPASWVWPALIGGTVGTGLGIGMMLRSKSYLDYDSDPPPASRVARAVSYSGSF